MYWFVIINHKLQTVLYDNTQILYIWIKQQAVEHDTAFVYEETKITMV